MPLIYLSGKSATIRINITDVCEDKNYNPTHEYSSERNMVHSTDAIEEILIIIHYKGHWIEENNFIDYEVCGVLVPRNCRYDEMIGMIQDAIKINSEMTISHMQYQIKPGYIPTTIYDEAIWKFYMAIKGINLDFDVHLCVQQLKVDATVQLMLCILT